MKKTETLHLLLKYEEKYKDTNINTIQEHINIDKNSGQVVWGVFTMRTTNNFNKSSISRLDEQISFGIPTFVFFYNKNTQSLYCADYLEAYGRKEFPIKDINLIPSYYQNIVNKDHIKDELTCQSYVRITNIRKIDFTDRKLIINEKSGVPLSEPSNSNTVYYVNIIDKIFHENLSSDFIAYIDEIVENITDDELEDTTIPNDLLERFTINNNPPKGLNKNFNKVRRKKNKSRCKSFLDAHKENEELGKLGEKYIFNYELQKVSKLQGGKWLDKVKWISDEDATSPYDIESVDENGNTIYIEVKTTKGYVKTPFFASIYEMNFSIDHEKEYYLYRLYEFNPKEKKSSLYIKQGNLYKTCEYQEMEFKLL